jgi:hypothetical protein
MFKDWFGVINMTEKKCVFTKEQYGKVAKEKCVSIPIIAHFETENCL